MHFNLLSGTGLRVSAAGFGGYRVSDEVPGHAAALRRALRAGINLIDTSANYTDGRSERLVGNVLGGLVAAGEVRREQVVVVSKAGYIQGRNFDLSRRRKQQGRPFPDRVPYADGLEHCIHPSFLAEQLSLSLQRLRLERLDAFLLHNPEYYLGWAAQNGSDLETARAEYERRIELAFRHLEKEVGQGRIQYYGVSSNTFPAAAADFKFTCLQRMWEIAASIAPGHHFRIIQLPLNLFETGAVLENNQPGGGTVLAFAERKRIGVLVNRPLNAFDGQSLVRLAEIDAAAFPGEEEIHRRVRELFDAETELRSEILPWLRLDAATAGRVAAQAEMAEGLGRHWRNFQSYDHWRSVRDEHLLPRARGVLDFVRRKTANRAVTSAGLTAYEGALHTLLQAVDGFYTSATAVRNRRIKQLAAAADPAWALDGTLSQTALRALRSTGGVSCVLVGMRRESYVQDVLEEICRPTEPKNRTDAWRRFEAARCSLEDSPAFFREDGR
jgi:aryl-alcohol dehydrogenase-like predicted oxidoreductase